MAYINSSGHITIDEATASQDAARAAQAERILQETQQQLKILMSEVDGYQGETRNAIMEKSQELLKQTTSLMTTLSNMQTYIHRVVEKYRRIDEASRAMIEQAKFNRNF